MPAPPSAAIASNLTDADWEEGFCAEVLRPCAACARVLAPAPRRTTARSSRSAAPAGASREASFTIGSSVNAPLRRVQQGARPHRGKDDGVQVNCIRPRLRRDQPPVASDRGRDEAHRPAGGSDPARNSAQRPGITRFGTLEDVAALTCFIVSKNGSWLHGATIDLDGGEIRYFEGAAFFARRAWPLVLRPCLNAGTITLHWRKHMGRNT